MSVRPARKDYMPTEGTSIAAPLRDPRHRPSGFAHRPKSQPPGPVTISWLPGRAPTDAPVATELSGTRRRQQGCESPSQGRPHDHSDATTDCGRERPERTDGNQEVLPSADAASRVIASRKSVQTPRLPNDGSLTVGTRTPVVSSGRHQIPTKRQIRKARQRRQGIAARAADRARTVVPMEAGRVHLPLRPEPPSRR